MDNISRITFDVRSRNIPHAGTLAARFINEFKDNHRAHRPERHGVIFSTDRGKFYVYGNPKHVRVREDEGNV